MRRPGGSLTLFVIVASILAARTSGAAEQVLSEPGTGTLVVPDNVSEITVELWGGGGAVVVPVKVPELLVVVAVAATSARRSR
ncbi:MAG: hypothetical protein GWN58_45775 [Anaerolineae bacterium]|nr:hypothetical protein [Anaerolineae bacterium]